MLKNSVIDRKVSRHLWKKNTYNVIILKMLHFKQFKCSKVLNSAHNVECKLSSKVFKLWSLLFFHAHAPRCGENVNSFEIMSRRNSSQQTWSALIWSIKLYESKTHSRRKRSINDDKAIVFNFCYTTPPRRSAGGALLSTLPAVRSTIETREVKRGANIATPNFSLATDHDSWFAGLTGNRMACW